MDNVTDVGKRDSMPDEPATNSHRNHVGRWLLWVLMIVAATHLIDFLFYGFQPRNLAAALCLVLVAFGLRRRNTVMTAAAAMLGIVVLGSPYLVSP